MVDTRENVAPEYKVGYTEIVVDKSEKVSNVSITTNKEKYIPRENVEINLEVFDKNNNPKQSQITLMVQSQTHNQIEGFLLILLWMLVLKR